MKRKRLTEAENQASKYESSSFAGAFWYGHKLGGGGGSRRKCPYDGVRNNAWRKAWLDGFDFGVREFNRRA